MKLYKNGKEYCEVVSFEKTGITKEVKQMGQSEPLEVLDEYELITTKKIVAEMGVRYAIDGVGGSVDLDLIVGKPEKVKEGYLIHVFTNDA